MIRLNTAKRKLVFSTLVLSALIAMSFLTIWLVGQDGGDTSWLPSMTMVYETDGDAVGVGNNPPVTIREVHRLEYRSKTDWVDTVIEASPIVQVIPEGVYDPVGSYQRVDGTQFTEFDASTNDGFQEVMEPKTIFLPHRALRPYYLRDLDQSPSRVDTLSKVCYGDDCEENVQGLLYVLSSGERVFLDDPRWDIPLRAGDWFEVRELEIHDVKP